MSLIRQCLLVFVAFLTTLQISSAGRAYAAEWTILIYMNGKNNLETDAIANFEDMASIGSTDKVNIVVEFGRPKNHEPAAAAKYGGWSGVYRFYVKPNMEPLPQFALPTPGRNPADVDMGSPATLNSFLSWGKAEYPANRYMVIIWNHGQGWRAESSPRSTESPSFTGGYRAVSFDDDTGSFLYNSEIATVISSIWNKGPAPKQLDLLGFDACSMSMIETAYSVRNSVRTMVASQELEPGAGWPYALWLSQLVKNPAMGDLKLARLIVDSYKKRYGNTQYTTLSVVNPSESGSVSSALSQLSVELALKLPQERAFIAQARAGIQPYGIWYDPKLNTSIDLITWLLNYQRLTKDAKIKRLITSAVNATRKQVIYNYASSRVLNDGYGGTGLAIYFPKNKADFQADPFRSGYLKANTDRPVEFVNRENWADFLGSYLQ